MEDIVNLSNALEATPVHHDCSERRPHGRAYAPCETVQELIRRLEADHARARHLDSSAIEEDRARRPEQTEPLEERLVLRVIRRDVGPEQLHAGQLGGDARISEGEAVHLLAGDAPIRIEVEQYRLAARACEHGIELVDALDAPPGRRLDLRGARTRSQSFQRPQYIAPAARGTDNLNRAQEYQHYANAFPHPRPATSLVRQRIENVQVPRADDEQCSPRQHLSPGRNHG